MLAHDSTHELDNQIKVVGVSAVSALLALQFGIIAFVRWAGRHNRGIPTWFSVATVVLECLAPTGIMMFHIERQTFPPYAMLLAPPILGYGMLTCLTTLRLRPALCILAGLVCAFGYTGVLLRVRFSLGAAEPSTGLPFAAYINVPALVFISALASAWVAREIRGHFEAALGEAETRHQMARIEHDLGIARSIQQALLPRAAPSITGFDIAGWNRSADQTGGDYFDWQELPDGTWIVTLADVSGHGIGPAMVTAACRAYVRASSLYHAELAALTSRINQLLAADLPEGRFVTMVSVVIDPRGGPLRLLSAGHGPIALYLGSTGEVRDILPQNLPLAVMSEMEFGPVASIPLAPGDVLALVTDGFVEWARRGSEGRGEEFGITRLRESLRRHAHLSSSAMIEAVAKDVSEFAGGEPQQDDLTMVVIRRV